MPFASAMPTHAGKKRGAVRIISYKTSQYANIADFRLCDRAAGPAFWPLHACVTPRHTTDHSSTSHCCASAASAQTAELLSMNGWSERRALFCAKRSADQTPKPKAKLQH
jgi:hypothetical protein